MAISAAGIIFSSLNNKTLSRLTPDRTVAAIPFACRYRLIDFCLSNLVNADISNIYIVANYNYRSLLEHIGSGKDWDLARREGGITMISPFQTAYASGTNALFSTHLEALKSMKEYINELKEDYVVLMDADNVLNIDIAKVIKEHEVSGAEVTFVTAKVDNDFTSKFPKMMISTDNNGKITDIAMSASYVEKNPLLSLNIFVMKTHHLRTIIEEADAYSLNSLTKMFIETYKDVDYRAYTHDGYVATVSSFLDYYKHSIALAKNPEARDSILWKKEFPIFTKVHNSAPTVHTSTAVVENSVIADECVIEGTVINSVIFRGVHIGRGTVVKDSVLFHGTYVEDNVTLNCIVTDKDVHITSGAELSGNPNMPFYIQKKRKV